MKELIYPIKTCYGIHARTAADISKNAKRFDCDIIVTTKGERADAKDVMELLRLSSCRGDSIKVVFRGKDEEKAWKEMNSHFLVL